MALLQIDAVAAGPLRVMDEDGARRLDGVFTAYVVNEHGFPVPALRREDMRVMLVRTPPTDPERHGWVTFAVRAVWPIDRQPGCYDIAIGGEVEEQDGAGDAGRDFPPGPYVLLFRIVERLGPRLIGAHGQTLVAMPIEAGA